MSRSASGPIRVLIVDDSRTIRELLTAGLRGDPELEVVGTAGDAYEARDLILARHPDVVTLDVEMPRMNGVEFLRRLMPQYPIPVVMVSGSVTAGGEMALAALEAGAVDIVLKPDPNSARHAFANMITELRAKLRIAAGANVSRWKRAVLPNHAKGVCPFAPPSSRTLVAIGASTGGTDATRRVLAGLAGDGPGIVVVQHMPAGFTEMYADRLNAELHLRVVEARDGDPILDGTVYVAPGEKQCSVVRRGQDFAIRLRQGPKVSGHCPSVDVMFTSVAASAGPHAVGVLLTGMGRDGADGLLKMRQMGARTLVQDQATSVVYGMPREAWQLGAAEAQIPIDDMAEAIRARLTVPVRPRRSA